MIQVFVELCLKNVSEGDGRRAVIDDCSLGSFLMDGLKISIDVSCEIEYGGMWCPILWFSIGLVYSGWSVGPGFESCLAKQCLFQCSLL